MSGWIWERAEPLWNVLSEATQSHPSGTFGFSSSGGEVFHRCLICDATFPQTDGGWAQLREHKFTEHEQPQWIDDWTELHGQTVEVAVVSRESSHYGKAELDQEIMLRTTDGRVYLLSHSADETKIRGMKWLPKSPESNLLRLMQNAQESPSNG